MYVPVQQTRPLQRYFTIAAIAVTPIVIAGFVPLYTLRLLRLLTIGMLVLLNAAWNLGGLPVAAADLLTTG